MSTVSISLILGGLIIFIISFVISYEWSDFPEIAMVIMLILGFIFIISGGILGYKEMNSKKCNNCGRAIQTDAKVCPYCGNKV